MNSRVALVYMSTLLLSCAAQDSPLSISHDSPTDNTWPTAPNTARIRYLNSIEGPGSFGFRESFSNQLKDIFSGSENTGMIRPYAIAVNAQMIAVADLGKGAIHLFNLERKKYQQIISIEKQPLISPVGIALGEKRIYIADSALNNLFILDEKRHLLKIIKDFQRVTALAYEPANHHLYVTDTNAHHILIYDGEGKYIGTFGERGNGKGQFNYPSHLAIANDRLYVNDTMNFRIQVFDLDGNHINTFGTHGVGPGYFAQPKGLGVNSDGHIFVAESVANYIQVFGPDGEFLMLFGGEDGKQAMFQSPAGIAISNDKIYVADSGNQRIQVFQYLGER